ncbi:MAG TPA: maltose alpha-D-glucosyltransferase [Chthoniobacteraceae bacterium]|nr:maltose alpha-D-glucosyltransferase [Chthoniobacteraceae bacterium]
MRKLQDDPLWYKDAIIYQLHVKAFYDSNGDGVGDFHGLMEKLDYLEELGVSAIWLLPFYPSPLRDDGYDIADYFSVHPNYGTLEDFQQFLDEAHRRGLRVITELVINHTSDQNPWFQRARKAPAGSPERDYYVWSDAPDRYNEARIIFKDFEHSNWTYDPIAKQYFWHRFYSHQPDLNFDNPAVHEAVLRVLDFWLDMGVDGLRLDAVPYLYERDGTNCENLPETHVYLRSLREHIDSRYRNRMLLAEANQWPEDAAAYFGNGDECHMNFHFPLMPRLFMSVQMEDRFPIIDILDQTPVIPENCQWATFLRNHDELTLEMVTDEERDYMYRMYASDPRARINLGIRRRLSPLMAGSRRKMELLSMLLFSLPGTPVMYYGDEIGMGDNFFLGDRNGVRTPMQWSPDRNAGFSRANPQEVYLPVVIDPEYHYESVNVENQERNLSSLLWWARRVISMRKRFRAFGRGTTQFLPVENGKVIAYIRQYEDETVLVVANLSRFAQVAELDLSAFAGQTLVEVFSRNDFPAIKPQTPYVFTLGSYDTYWLALQPELAKADVSAGYSAPTFSATPGLDILLDGALTDSFESRVLPEYLQACRWFGGKTRGIRTLRVGERIPVGVEKAEIILIDLTYFDGGMETYLLPLQIASGAAAAAVEIDAPQAIIARFAGDEPVVLFDAVHDEKFRAAIYELMAQQTRQRAVRGVVAGFPGAALAEGGAAEPPASRVLKVEQSNSSIIYQDRWFLKLYRRIEEGVNPDAEILRFLSERRHFEYVPPFGGSIEYKRPRSETRVLGLLLGMVPNEGDAWATTLDSLSRFYERVLESRPDAGGIPALSLFTPNESASAVLTNLIGGIYPERARQLGVRTAQMHFALAGEDTDASFAPEPFTTLYQRSIYQSMRGSLRRTMGVLQRRLPHLDGKYRKLVLEIVADEPAILARMASILRRKIHCAKIRTHGDYHLGQVLNTGKDFVIIDFEGEPSRSLSERKLKRSALRDVAGMLRSFHYAAHTALSLHQHTVRPEDIPLLEPWAEHWANWIGSAYLQSYLQTADAAPFIPDTREDTETLLDAYLLEKAVYEVGYELNNRPNWISIPLRGIQQILGDRAV